MSTPKYVYHVTLLKDNVAFRQYGACNKIDAIVILRGLIPTLNLRDSKDMIDGTRDSYPDVLSGMWTTLVTVTHYCHVVNCAAMATSVVETYDDPYRIVRQYYCTSHTPTISSLAV